MVVEFGDGAGQDWRSGGEDVPVDLELLSVAGLDDHVGALLVVDQVPEIGGERVVVRVVLDQLELADQLDVAV